MNYRHSFHAGNFADIVKHALVLWLLEARQSAAKGPVAVFDTHAGAGLYDLSGDATRSREAEAGVAKLMAASGLPPWLEALADQVRAVNPDGLNPDGLNPDGVKPDGVKPDGTKPDGGVRVYPGSPVLIARSLRRDDRYTGFELSGEAASLLVGALRRYPNAAGRTGDGYRAVLAEAAGATGPLVLIDPPFEQPDDYVRAAETATAIVQADPAATVAIWTPIKDLETFDGFLRRLQPAQGVMVAEVRLRPLTNPMTMNGCAMVVVNPPEGCDAAAASICGWVAETLGEAGARADIWRL